ncbi:6 7-dimethyl-8-ribityllumazine synthase [Bienertia sinuspersici]
MPLPLVNTLSTFPSSHSLQSSLTFTHFNQNSITLLPKSLLPGFSFGVGPTFTLKYLLNSRSYCKRNYLGHSYSTVISASLLDNPILWAGRLCGFYALLKAGFAGSQSSPILSGTEISDDDADLGFSKWMEKFQKNPDKEASDKRKLVSKWHPTTKGTLKRNYRVPSKPEGRRLLKAIASLLSEDDHFKDASSHKGCQIRRESAHGESVCCNNVRALFDELPTPHLILEITPFPVGSLTEKDYAKAEKLEKVLRSSPSV